MPSTWKTSLALDLKLPGDVDLNIEGIYNKDFNSVTVTKLGIEENPAGIQLPANLLCARHGRARISETRIPKKNTPSILT